MSHIDRNGKEVRPAWKYGEVPRYNIGIDQLEMLESCRNAIEEVRNELQKLNRVFSCGNFLSLPQVLQKVEKNTRKRKRRRQKARI